MFMLYANVGPKLLQYQVDVPNAALSPSGSIELPSELQYLWPHCTHQVLYAATSDRKSNPGRHFLVALKVDPRTGALSPHGAPLSLPDRPIHMTTDIRSQHVLVAFSDPSGLRVYRIASDMTLAGEVVGKGIEDSGIYAHQIRVTHDNRHAILVTRGHSATKTHPEEPGALKWFDYDHNSGALTNELSVAPNGGFGFGPRHLDFHPTQPWVYVSLERQSKLQMFRIRDGKLEAEPAFSKDTVQDPARKLPRQLSGAIRVHPDGRHVYVANRSDDTIDFNGVEVRRGGENSIAVFDIDPDTGEPTLAQRVDTQKVHPRTFSMDPQARLMAVQHNLPIKVRDADAIKTVQAGFSMFRMDPDGRLEFERAYDIDVGASSMWWMGMLQV